MIYPINNPQITQEYGHTWFALNYGKGVYPNVDGKPFHNGVDFSTYNGQNLYSIRDGVVVISTNNPSGWGQYIRIKHQDGKISHYAHLQERLVFEKNNVKEGQLIGKCDNTGWSTGSHLHFGIYDEQNNFNNPIKYLDNEGEPMPQGFDENNVKNLVNKLDAKAHNLIIGYDIDISTDTDFDMKKIKGGSTEALAERIQTYFNLQDYWMKKTDCNAGAEKERADSLRIELGNSQTKILELQNQLKEKPVEVEKIVKKFTIGDVEEQYDKWTILALFIRKLFKRK